MKTQIHKNESGLASLVIAILIVIIVSTMVLGFMQIIRREQRRTLDNQLSSQAQFAAESGVNDAQKAINDGYTGKKTQCGPLLPGPSIPSELTGTSNQLSAGGNVQYSCLLIDPNPPTLVFDSIKTDKSTVFPIRTSDDTAINTITFSWQDKDSIAAKVYKGAPNGSTDFSPQASWGVANGVIRVQLVPIFGNNISRAGLVAKTKTVFLYPSAGPVGSAAVDYGTVVDGQIIAANCNDANAPNHCQVTFSNSTGSTNLVYARVTAIYRPAQLTVSLTNAAGAINTKDGQILVDSTGKAADVTRRIQVRVPVNGDTDTPEAAIQSVDSICKKFSITSSPDNVVADDGDPACNPNPIPN